MIMWHDTAAAQGFNYAAGLCKAPTHCMVHSGQPVFHSDTFQTTQKHSIHVVQSEFD